VPYDTYQMCSLAMSVLFKYFIAYEEMRQANELLCVSLTVAIFVEEISHSRFSVREKF
jgi:hypothetical protein